MFQNLTRDEFENLAAATTLCLGATAVYHLLKQKQSYQDQIKFIKTSKIIQMKDFMQQQIQRLQKTTYLQQKEYQQKFLIKTIPQASEININSKIYSSQIQFCPPSVNPMLKKVISTYNNFNQQKPMTNNKVFVDKKGIKMGIVMTDKFQAKTNFYSRQNLKQIHQQNLKDIQVKADNLIKKRQYAQYRDYMEQFTNQLEYTFFQKCKKTVSSILQRILSILRFRYRNKISKNDNRSPLIKGIFQGVLHTQFNLLKNTYFLLKVRIQGNQIVSQMIGDNRIMLIKYYTDKIFHLNMRLSLVSAMMFGLGCYMYYKMHKVVKIALMKVNLKDKKYLKIEDKVGDDKLCQICYTNCRNVVFFNCRHYIMCYDCLEAHPEDKCFLCSTPIQKATIVYSKI